MRNHKQPSSTKTNTATTLATTSVDAKKRSVVPIPNTIESIKGYPEKLVLFKVPASPFWWVRYYDGKPIKRSTKSENKAEAIRFAKEFYETLLVNKRTGVSNNKRKSSFVTCAEGVIEEDKLKFQRGELADRYVKTQKTLINKHVLAFFKSHEVGAIDYALLDKFKTYLYEKQLAPSSIKIHFVALSKIFRYAQQQGLISRAPLFPKLKTEDNARSYFKLNEYKLLLRTAKRLIGKVTELRQITDAETGTSKKLRNVTISKELYLLIRFMVYTFIRPTDLKQMQHHHIEPRKDSAGKHYLFMPIPESKGHSKPIVSMPRAHAIYQQLCKLHQDHKSTDYVFLPELTNRDYAYAQLTRQFDAVLAAANLKTDMDGQGRTLYSLRHTSLTYRILYGAEIDALNLARNARTSPEMLHRFYLSKLENEQLRDKLHAKKEPRRTKKKESAVYMKLPHELELPAIIEQTQTASGNEPLIVDGKGNLVRGKKK